VTAAASPGRSCPTAYHYGPAVFRRPPELVAETLYAAGGLYGNLLALHAIEALAAQEAATLVFNGDFHWFDAEPGWFAEVQAGVLRHVASRGNVETEIAASESLAGCGCAYPLDVDDGVVERSNRIARRLREVACQVPQAAATLLALARLPMHWRAQVGGHQVAVVHGDAHTLAGWQFDAARLHAPQAEAALHAVLDQAGVDVFASSHTCLPGLRSVGQRGVVVNNGAAGMPNFAGTCFGLVTRLSVHAPGPGLPVLYGRCHELPAGLLHVHALRVDFDAQAWQDRFLATWPEGSDAHRSYWPRICQGPAFQRAEMALAPGAPLAHAQGRP
jgi:hypothetical protein